MVFFVHLGRVTIDVGTPSTRFSLGKGGQWQVPRGMFSITFLVSSDFWRTDMCYVIGNFYAISNESETRDARVFFAQGCEWGSSGREESVVA